MGFEVNSDGYEGFHEKPVLYRENSVDVHRSVAAAVILDEMEGVKGPEIFELDGSRASVSPGRGYEDLYDRGLQDLEPGPSDETVLNAYAARIALGDGDHFSGNYVASDSEVVPIDFEVDSHPVSSLCRAGKYLEDGSVDAPDVEINDEEIRPYLVSRVQELAESVDLDMVETRLRTRYGEHRDSLEQKQLSLPRGARHRINMVEMSKNLDSQL